jgi:hypothetical protein
MSQDSMSDQQQELKTRPAPVEGLLGDVSGMDSTAPDLGGDTRQGDGPVQPSGATSALRAEAARRNGSQSHGPVTDEGKNRSRMNALKHGLRAETLLLHANNEEDNAALQALRERVASEFPGQTLMAELLRENLVHALWQQIRCFEFEDRELSQDLIFHGPVTDRLLRYSNGADKRLFCCLEALKRLQEESTPAPAPQEEGTEAQIGEE